mgnify:CR=1 FL=1
MIITLVLAACSANYPTLDETLTDESRDAEYPSLVPLNPLLVGLDVEVPRVAAEEGTSLEARAEALRARAAWLRSLPL